MAKTTPAALLILGAVGTSSVARAETPAAEHDEERSSLVGTKLIQENIVDDGIEHGGGISVYAERSVLGGAIDVEVNGSLVWFERGRSAPFEVLVKKAFVVSRNLTPYVAFGPTASIEDFHDVELHAGAAAVVGTYLWWSRRWGFDVDATYAAFVHPRTSHEVTIGFGSAYRF